MNLIKKLFVGISLVGLLFAPSIFSPSVASASTVATYTVKSIGPGGPWSAPVTTLAASTTASVGVQYDKAASGAQITVVFTGPTGSSTVTDYATASPGGGFVSCGITPGDAGNYSVSINVSGGSFRGVTVYVSEN